MPSKFIAPAMSSIAPCDKPKQFQQLCSSRLIPDDSPGSADLNARSLAAGGPIADPYSCGHAQPVQIVYATQGSAGRIRPAK